MAFRLPPVFMLILFISLNVASCSLVTISYNGGYRQIIVAISPALETVEIEPLLTRLEDLLRRASVALHVATKKQLYLEEVIITLPHSFNLTSVKGMKAESKRKLFGKPDIFITENGLFEDSPFTLQHGGCGERGLRMYYPASFLARHSSEKAFVHEWAHYRFGVFDEHGFPNDPLYPLVDQIPGTESESTYSVTGCTNQEPIYTFTNASGQTCDPESSGCYPWLDEKNNMEIVSSLMDQKLFPQISQFCDGESLPHNRASPSMHNVLCKEKSVWEVLHQNEDFKNRRNPAEPLPTKFRYFVESEPRFVFIIEATANLAINDRVDLVRNAFSYFALYDLPKKGKMWMMNLRKLVSPYTFVNLDSSVESLLDAFPEAYGNADVCVECGINEAIKTLTRDDAASDGFIILVTTVDISRDQLEKLTAHLDEANAKLFVIFFGEVDATPPLLEQLALNSGGKLFYIMEGVKTNPLISPLTILYEAFRSIYESILWRNRNKALVEQKIFYKEVEEASMSFAVDESVETLQVILTGPKFIFGPPIIRDKLVLKFNDTEYRAGQSSFSYTIRIPAYIFTIQNPQVGNWKLTFQRKKDHHNPIVVMVRATHAKYGKLLNTRGWISPSQGDAHRPWIIHAEILNGYQPVVTADVVAILHHHASGKETKLKLLDYGEGNPDIRKYDGIYSRGLTGISMKGYYTLTVVAEKVYPTMKARVLEWNTKNCCGSYVGGSTIVIPNAFKRISTVGPIYLDGEILTAHFPPRRIGDLHITGVHAPRTGVKQFTVQWTAPGENYDFGKAARYEIKVFRTRDDAMKKFDTAHALNITEWEIQGPFLTPAYAGTIQTIILQLNNLTSGTYFLAMRAIDKNGNFGEISNLVEFYHTAPLKPTSATTPSEVQTTPMSSDAPDPAITTAEEYRDSGVHVIIGVTCAILFLLLIIGLFLLVYLSKRRKAKKCRKETISPPYFPRRTTEGNPGIYRHAQEFQRKASVENQAYSTDSPLFNREKAGSPNQSCYSFKDEARPQNPELLILPTLSRRVQDNMSVASGYSSSVYSTLKRGYEQTSLYDTGNFHNTLFYEQTNLPFSPTYTSSLRRQHDNDSYSSRLGTDV